MTDTQDRAPSSGRPEEATVVLAAVDTSPAAGLVIDVAARLARRAWHSARLHVVHVFRAGPLEASGPERIPLDHQVHDAKEYLDYNVRATQRQCGSPVAGHFAEGDAADEILSLAWSLGADLIVVGANEPVGPRRWLFRSVAQKLVKRAPCAVLVVRHKQRPYVKVA